MGQKLSVIETTSNANWIPNELIIKHIRDIENIKASGKVEKRLLNSLAGRISNVDGVQNCDIVEVPRGWFRPKKVYVTIQTDPNQFSYSGTATYKPLDGIKTNLIYSNAPHTGSFSFKFYPLGGYKFSVNTQHPILQYLDLTKNFSIPHASLHASTGTYKIGTAKYNTTEFKAALADPESNIKGNIFVRLRKLGNNSHYYMQPFSEYVTFGVSGTHKFRTSTGILEGSHRELLLRVRQRSEAFAAINGNRSSPILKYTASAVAALPPNLIVRAAVGTTLSTAPVPYADRFHIGGAGACRATSPGTFSPHSGSARCGLSHFASASTEFRVPIAGGVFMHAFADAAVGALTRTANVHQSVPAAAHCASAGIGIVACLGRVNAEANVAVPFWVSNKLQVSPLHVQLTMGDDE